MKKQLTLLVSGVLCAIQLMAQNTAATSGGTASGAGGSATYTIGQTGYTTQTGTGGTVTLGVQQPFEIVVVSGVKETTIQLKVVAHPNPVQDWLQLTIDATEVSGISYTLSDVAGKTLQSQSVLVPATLISFKEYASGTYFLSVLRKGEAVKTFKLIRK